MQQHWQAALEGVPRAWHSFLAFLGWLIHLNIHWMYQPSTIISWAVATALVGALIAWWNLSWYTNMREYWEERVELDTFTPRDRRQYKRLWKQSIAIPVVLVVALGGPNLSSAPLTVPAGSVREQLVADVSNSFAALDGRAFYGKMSGESEPDPAVEWGTRLDIARQYFKADLLPQLANNKAGVIACGGVGYNTWDITSDLAVNGALMHMLNQHLKIGAAPFGGCDYASALQSALDELDLITGKEHESGDWSEKVDFITLASDGGNTSTTEDLDKVIAKLNERHVHLLLVQIGGEKAMTVEKTDPKTHRYNGQFFLVPGTNMPATTRVEPVRTADGQPAPAGVPLNASQVASGEKSMLYLLRKVQLADLIYAPPGTMHISYSFPEKLGGLVAVANESNLRPWLLSIACALFFSVTAGGGGWPRWRLFVPRIRLLAIWAGITRLGKLASRLPKGSK